MEVSISKRMIEISSKLDYVNEICSKLQQENYRLKDRLSELERFDSEIKAQFNSTNQDVEVRLERLEASNATVYTHQDTRADDLENSRDEIKKLVISLREGVESVRRSETKERNDRKIEMANEKRARQNELKHFQSMIETKALKQQRQQQELKDTMKRHDEFNSRLTEKITSLEAMVEEKINDAGQHDRKEGQDVEISRIKADNEEVIKKMKLLEQWVLSKHMAKERQKQEMSKNSFDTSLTPKLDRIEPRRYEQKKLSTHFTVSTDNNGHKISHDENNILNSVEDIDLQIIAFALRAGLEVKNRSYHLRTYHDCFIGNEAVDFMLEQDLAKSRLAATRICQVLGTMCDMFAHVTNDHYFKDEYLFYRFKKPELRYNVFDSSSAIRCIDLDVIAAAMKSGVRLCDRVHRLKTYKNVFLASEAIDFLVEKCFVSNREDAVRVGRCLGTTCNQFYNVLGEEVFKDNDTFFRFQSNEKCTLGRFLCKTEQRLGSLIWQIGLVAPNSFDKNVRGKAKSSGARHNKVKFANFEQ